MMEAWADGHVIASLQAQRELDMAKGILMGLRRCSPAVALRELLGAAKRHRLGVNGIATALVHLAYVRDQSAGVTAEPAHSAAYLEWGDLLDDGDRSAHDAPGKTDPRHAQPA
jgi:ANTAR domain